MPGPINRTRPGVTEGWWLGLTMCVTLTSRIFSQQPGRWCVRFAHRPRLARIAHIRKGTEADGFPAVLAHHRAVAAMLALSVEGFFAYALHRVVWGHARSGEGGLRCSSAMFLITSFQEKMY
jgi:hypothetical protein